jgi:hypothetical protein
VAVRRNPSIERTCHGRGSPAASCRSCRTLCRFALLTKFWLLFEMRKDETDEKL